MVCQNLLGNISLFPRTTVFFVYFSFSWCNWSWKACNFQVLLVHSSRQAYVTYVALGFSEFDRRNICRKQTLHCLLQKQNYHGFIQRVLSTAIYAIFNQPIMICLVIYQFAMESSQLKRMVRWFTLIYLLRMMVFHSKLLVTTRCIPEGSWCFHLFPQLRPGRLSQSGNREPSKNMIPSQPWQFCSLEVLV